jgi:hypothetical protein
LRSGLAKYQSIGMSLVVRRTHQPDKQTETTEVSAVMSESQNCERSVECGVLGTRAVIVIQLSTGLKSLNKSALLVLSSSQAEPRACVGSMPLRARAKRAVG